MLTEREMAPRTPIVYASGTEGVFASARDDYYVTLIPFYHPKPTEGPSSIGYGFFMRMAMANDFLWLLPGDGAMEYADEKLPDCAFADGDGCMHPLR